MFFKVNSFGVRGVEGFPVSVEADVSEGLPSFILVGYLAGEVKEAQERVRTAMKNAGFRLPPRRITVNLAPAGVRKEGTGFDLAIAAAVLGCLTKEPKEEKKDWAYIGELGLDGSVRPVPGILPRVYAAREAGVCRVFLPSENTAEGTAVEGVEIVGVADLAQLADLLAQPQRIRGAFFSPQQSSLESLPDPEVDFDELAGLPTVRRACEAAAAGRHNLLLIGPAGTGKTMAARRLPTILPPLALEERLQVSGVYSICGLLTQKEPLIRSRPFRSPHHGTTPQAMAGGGKGPKPGEVSLATQGILFLDELAEFHPQVLDLLREPMEEGSITVSRMNGALVFPADALVVAAMNPCKCGFYPDMGRCRCTPAQIRRYLSRVSGPFLDRIDIGVEVPRQDLTQESLREKGESSAVMRGRVERAVRRQRERFAKTGISCNGRMGRRQIEEFCALGAKEEELLDAICQNQNLSLRGRMKLLKVSRTLADLDEAEAIGREQLAEAAAFRSFEARYWGQM